MTRRTFIVFESEYAAADGVRLLGRVVLDPRRPLAGYRPRMQARESLSNVSSAPENARADSEHDATKGGGSKHDDQNRKPEPVPAAAPEPEPFLKEFVLTSVTDKNTTIKAQSFKSTKARLNLTKLLSISGSSAQLWNLTLRAESLQNFGLEQYGDVYDALIAKHAAELDELMAQQAEGEPLYMMVTLKTATRLRVLSVDDSRKELGTDAQAPIGEALIAGGAPPGTGTALLGTMRAKVKRTVTRAEALKLVAAEERAVAAEYCEIVRTPKARFSLRARAEQKRGLKLKNHVSVFSGDHTSFGPPSEEKQGSQGKDADESDEEVYK